jgi:hypothetical protein
MAIDDCRFIIGERQFLLEDMPDIRTAFEPLQGIARTAFRLNRREAARLLLTISAQMAALMGAYWGSNLLSSLLKTASAGLSTTLTAAAQGALAWYATLVTGQMAETWFSRGKSWGSKGPQETAREIIASLDRDEVLMQARDELAAKLAAPKP